MHEAMVAESLLAAISAEAAKHNARPVWAKISCGKLYTINDDALCFAFEVLAAGTPCEGAKLEIEFKPLQASCKNCNEVFEFEVSLLKCAECGSDEFELMPDAPLLLEEIEFETE
jgi:hydrogenase nickel incorporation protein HypA/HybF